MDDTMLRYAGVAKLVTTKAVRYLLVARGLQVREGGPDADLVIEGRCYGVLPWVDPYEQAASIFSLVHLARREG